MSRFTRDKVCQLCYTCVNQCRVIEEITSCENYKKGVSRFEYLELIRNQNVNVKKLCTKNNLSYNIMMNMLHGRQLFSYKYAIVLNSRLYEKTEYLPYIDKFEQEDGVVAYG